MYGIGSAIYDGLLTHVNGNAYAFREKQEQIESGASICDFDTKEDTMDYIEEMWKKTFFFVGDVPYPVYLGDNP
jgi:hypothetical protein